MTSPSVAVVGRQNVGKSTLANRLFGRRETIAHPMPGVTRDRVELETTWRGRPFRLVDTGGHTSRGTGIDALVSRQADRAAELADVIVLVVDGRTGPVEEDATLARKLRRAEAPVVLVVNKIDAADEEVSAAVFHRLGLGEPVAVSAMHGLGVGELLDRLVALLPDAPRVALEDAREPRFALVGRPNVGKSSLFNRLVEEERSVVFEEAGTTRDAVDAVVRWQDVVVRFVDTAGFRRGSKVKSVEYFSLLRAERAIERADVAVLVLDATDGLAAEDKRVAAKVMEAGRALLVVANKWDLVEDRDRTYKELGERVNVFARASVARTSARSGLGVHRLPPLLLGVRERWSRRVPTSEVNRVLQEAVAERPVPGGGHLKYATQVSAGPPTFVLFGARGPDASYQRFLEGRLRAAFGFDGVPIRLRFRAPRGRARHGVASG